MCKVNHAFASPSVVTESGKDPQWMLKAFKKGFGEQDIHTVSKCTSHIELLVKKRGDGYIFTLGKPSGYCHRRSNPSMMGQTDSLCLLMHPTGSTSAVEYSFQKCLTWT